MKPNKRMSMAFIVAAFGIPFAWEFYTGSRSNDYNEKKFNSAEEIAWGKTISRFLRLFRRAYGTSEGQNIFMDNLFTSIFLLYILRTQYKALATGTHRVNALLPELTWGAKFERGEYRWATAIHEGVSFLYLEYGDNKMVRFLSTLHGSPHANPGETKERWDSETRTYQDIFLPSIKLDYDAGMMWVDMVDMLESMGGAERKQKEPKAGSSACQKPRADNKVAKGAVCSVS
ncbi:hypothetical protein CYMTET_11937 [Cymbomonas tetramitiformis]|uniref:PiggyBac transposable element-derived protein domain-containing protein n=1 Tax=Cymbomonas tetramitiformis TaxID=36881 RepID=A0AAE0BBH6_9CHLO|nr:hypothetical protein CYMTET_56157 [Cymbomonas tetramitiformis]KAK3247935.1 hypothetical protein CYMTET_42579 [Cymbomonas tetramitiformis]KAK3280215.1 hypothetical protein CYMTET_11937 [Cymbomonas tetramitiformis]